MEVNLEKDVPVGSLTAKVKVRVKMDKAPVEVVTTVLKLSTITVVGVMCRMMLKKLQRSD